MYKKTFWLSFVASLAVFFPLLLGMLAYINATQSQPAETPQQGIRIAQPTTFDQKTVLVMTGKATAQSPDSFVLVHFNALENRISAVALPPETIVLAAGTPQTLARAVRSAGPSQGISALAETLHIPIDDYLFTAPDVLWQAAESFGSVPLRLDTYLPPEVVQSFVASADGIEAQRLSPRSFAQVLASPAVPRDALQTLRAAGYAEFLRVGSGLLQQTLPAFVRRSSASIATDITATELYDYERILRFLDKQEPTCRATEAPGAFVARADGTQVYELAPAASELAQDYFLQPPPAVAEPEALAGP